ncbi:MAG: hypothetical protein OEZ13_05720 [Spirochaetia bacterium]|nr:hypothetical protein [Spirochaetia bacterium]
MQAIQNNISVTSPLITLNEVKALLFLSVRGSSSETQDSKTSQNSSSVTPSQTNQNGGRLDIFV